MLSEDARGTCNSEPLVKNIELGQRAKAFALGLDGFDPSPVGARYDCLYLGEPCHVVGTRRASYTQSTRELIDETVWWLWVLIDDDTGEVLAHDIVPKAEHDFGKPYVNFKYMAPARVRRRFEQIVG